MRAGSADIDKIEAGNGARLPRGGGRMPAQARQARIVEAVRSTGFVSVVDIAADLVVSEMTIRRDLMLGHECEVGEEAGVDLFARVRSLRRGFPDHVAKASADVFEELEV